MGLTCTSAAVVTAIIIYFRYEWPLQLIQLRIFLSPEEDGAQTLRFCKQQSEQLCTDISRILT